jgi:hypothetical protein
MRLSLRAAAVLALLAGSGCVPRRAPPPEMTPAWTPPPGAVPVALLSDTVRRRWDVYVNDQFVCSTPCKRSLDPAQPVILHEHGQELGDELRVPNLFPAAREGPVALHLTTPNDGLRSTASVVTVIGVIPGLLGGLVTPFACAFTLSRGENPSACYALATVTAAGLGLYGIGVGLYVVGSPKPAVTTTRQYLAGGTY